MNRTTVPKSLTYGIEQLEMNDFGWHYEVAIYFIRSPDGQIIHRRRGKYFKRLESANKYFDRLLKEENFVEKQDNLPS